MLFDAPGPAAAAAVERRAIAVAAAAVAASSYLAADFKCAYPVVDRSELLIGNQLGVGTYGSVYHAVWRSVDGIRAVALKKVFILEKEVEILSKIRHRNIIQFYGVCPTNPDFFIVTEYASNGSLYDYLHNADNADLSFIEIGSWAEEIAQGLHYLHYEAPETIIHRDLKSKNVVLGDKYSCKLCDFGTSKNLTHTQTAWTWGGTAAWMSPEIINQSSSGISTATDVWSFAVVLWEMLTREIPYDGLTEFRIYSLIAEYGTKLVVPESCPDRLKKLMNNCWKRDPRERIDFKQILMIVRAMKYDDRFGEECQTFLEKKEAWKPEILNQLRQLKKRELKIARKTAELDRLEQQIAQRKCSSLLFFNARQNSAGLPPDDVTYWNEEHVCDWVKGLNLDVTESASQLLMNSIRRHQINGQRLLNLTKNDLKFLGIASLGLRLEIAKAIKQLRKDNVKQRHIGNHNGDISPSTQLSRPWSTESESTDSNVSRIVIQVLMYQRQKLDGLGVNYRFKILVDSDWAEDQPLPLQLPPKLRDANSLIQSVVVTNLRSDQTKPIGEPSKRSHAPFGPTHWMDAPLGGVPVQVICAVAFSDRVLRPRNVRLEVPAEDFTKPSVLLERTIDLTLRPYAKKLRRERDSSQPLPLFHIGPSPTDSTATSVDSGVMSRQTSVVSPIMSLSSQPLNDLDMARPLIAQRSVSMLATCETVDDLTPITSNFPLLSYSSCNRLAGTSRALSEESLLRHFAYRHLAAHHRAPIAPLEPLTNSTLVNLPSNRRSAINDSTKGRQKHKAKTKKAKKDPLSGLTPGNVGRRVHGGGLKMAWRRTYSSSACRNGGGDTVCIGA